MFDDIRADFLRVHRSTAPLRPGGALLLLWRNHGLQALLVYRLGRWLGRLKKTMPGRTLASGLHPLWRLLDAMVRNAYGIHLEQSAEISPGLYIGHLGGIVVRHCRIGRQCAISQRVELGPVEARAGGPVIGRCVWIGAHAKILADVNIGDGATIGAGAIVSEDVPDRCLVLGNPGRIAQRDYDNSAFL